MLSMCVCVSICVKLTCVAYRFIFISCITCNKDMWSYSFLTVGNKWLYVDVFLGFGTLKFGFSHLSSILM